MSIGQGVGRPLLPLVFQGNGIIPSRPFARKSSVSTGRLPQASHSYTCVSLQLLTKVGLGRDLNQEANRLGAASARWAQAARLVGVSRRFGERSRRDVLLVARRHRRLRNTLWRHGPVNLAVRRPASGNMMREFRLMS